MAKVKILVGSNNEIPSSLLKKYDIKVIPFSLSLGEKNFKDGDITQGEFLEKIKATKLFPKTAALSVGELANAYKELTKEGNSIVSIHMSSGLTAATLYAAQNAKKITKADVEIIDTKQTCGGVGLIVLEAAKAAEQGKTKEEVVKITKKVISRTNSIFALPDMEYLYRGGRIGKAKSLMGSLLKIIPLIAIRDQTGVVTPVGKARNISQANEKIIETIKLDMGKTGAKKIKCIISHVDNKPAADELKNSLQKNFECEQIIETEANCVAIVYTGPKAWGVSYYLIGGKD